MDAGDEQLNEGLPRTRPSEVDVSVVIPTRDRPEELARAVSAALGQCDVDLELIVIDDGSRVPARVTDGHGRTRLLRLEQSGGVSRARNRGIAEARGRWVAFLDDDDIWAPDRLARLLAIGEAADADIVWSGTVTLDTRGRALKVRSLPEPERVAEALRSLNVLGGPSAVVVRRRALERTGGFDPTFSVLADWELWIRLTASGRLAACADVLNGYVMHSEGMAVTRTDEALTEFAELGRRYGTAERRGEPGMYDELFMRWAGSVYRRGGRRMPAARLFWRNWRRHRDPADLRHVLTALLGERLLQALSPSVNAGTPTPPWIKLYQDHPGAQLRPMRPSAERSEQGPAVSLSRTWPEPG